MKTPRLIRNYAFPIVITIVFIFFLTKTIDIRESLEHFTGIHVLPLIAAFFIYVIQYFFLALRWRLLTNEAIGVAPFFCVTAVHTMTNNLMPMRTGEVMYPLLLKRYFNIGFGDSTATLVYARIFDVFAMGIFVLVALIFGWDRLHISLEGLRGESFRFLICVFLLLLVIVILYRVFVRLTGDGKKAHEGSLLGTLKKGLDSLVRGMKRVEIVKVSLELMLLSLAVFLARYVFFMYTLMVFGISVTFLEAVLMASLPIITAAIPAQGIGGYGTIETGWVLGFLLMGLSKETALVVGFGIHTMYLVFSVMLGGISFPLLGLVKKRREKRGSAK
jgi:glycosyltransferase 2 family protein